jgi:two-component system KDP operon response regulator KdpE
VSEGRILVVDDEPQIHRFLKPALTAAGYEPLQASTAAEAERLAATAAPDLMILDLGLPDKDGKDVIRSLRGWSKLPIVVLSARDQEAEKIEALDLGADDYVESPSASGNCSLAYAPLSGTAIQRRSRRHATSGDPRRPDGTRCGSRSSRRPRWPRKPSD